MFNAILKIKSKVGTLSVGKCQRHNESGSNGEIGKSRPNKRGEGMKMEREEFRERKRRRSRDKFGK